MIYRHPAEGALHGKTIVVETRDGALYIGRCSRFVEDDLILVHADAHREGPEALPRADYLREVKRVGHWPRIEKTFLPRTEILSVTLLVEYPAA